MKTTRLPTHLRPPVSRKTYRITYVRTFAFLALSVIILGRRLAELRFRTANSIALPSPRASAKGQNEAPAAWIASGVCSSGVCGYESVGIAGDGCSKSCGDFP